MMNFVKNLDTRNDKVSDNESFQNFKMKINQRLQTFAAQTGYKVYDMKYYRKIALVNDSDLPHPERGSEIFVSKIPPDVIEDELFQFFSNAGTIFSLRLMQCPSGIANRGFAYIRFNGPHQATHAIKLLRTLYFRPYCRLSLRKSYDNNRLFICGIPPCKTKMEIWNELVRVGMHKMVDLIAYKPHTAEFTNRGYVLVEFGKHEDAATAKKKFKHTIVLWGMPLVLDWAINKHETFMETMSQVTTVFLRNLHPNLTHEQWKREIMAVLNPDLLKNVYKNTNYSFIHFVNHESAEAGFNRLQKYYAKTNIQVEWAIPAPPINTNNNNRQRRGLQNRRTTCSNGNLMVHYHSTSRKTY